MIYSFAPWIDTATRACVVGTMPGEASLAAGMYYAHPRNRFWTYAFRILNGGEAVSDRKALLLHHGIGLWDALSACDRQGSLDSAIKNPAPNDFSRFPQIRLYLFNGRKAFALFKRFNGALLSAENHLVLPSTSPANASVREDDKFKAWKDAFERV